MILRPTTLLLFFGLFITYTATAQQAIGTWKEHLPYNRGKVVVETPAKIYCATQDALFALVKEDNSIERFTKLNGMSDFGINTIGYNSTSGALIIGYENGNIDLLYDDGSMFNISAIVRKNITGSKKINSIYMRGNLAYLGCGFGIVVLDVGRQEVKETYYIGSNGTALNVFEVTDDGNYIYAATDSGVYNALLSNPNLSDFNNWSEILDDAGNLGDYNMIEYFAGKILVNYAKPEAGISNTDELWVWDNGIWSQLSIPELPAQPKRYSFRVSENKFIVTTNDHISVFDNNIQRINFFDNTYYSNVQMYDAVLSGAVCWIADYRKGLVKIENNNATAITPQGPTSAFAGEIAIQNNRLWIAHGPRSTSWNPQQYPVDGFSTLYNGQWTSWNNFNLPALGTNKFYSNMSLSIVPGQSEHIMVGSVTTGLLDFENGAIKKFYTATNSTLLPAIGNPGETKVHGIAHDEKGNLWVANSGVVNAIHCFKTDGTWKTFNMQGVVNGAPFTGSMLVDKNNFKWLTFHGGAGTTTSGVLVLDDNGTIDNEADDRKAFIKIETNTPRCIAMDKDGQLWLGTDHGPLVIYSPSAAFDTVVPQQILIQQDNNYQYLLETEIVTAIAVDGANRKWMGTQNSGIYLFSADGQEELQHFTSTNSPLFSNTITCITINEATGEVYIGTDKGMVSYQSDALEGEETCGDVTVYPNPVRPGYNGPIAVKGVIGNSIIKITDISGTLVHQSKALGGQAIWNGRNLNGEKVHTGVYLVFSADENGENSCVTKLLLVN